MRGPGNLANREGEEDVSVQRIWQRAKRARKEGLVVAMVVAVYENKIGEWWGIQTGGGLHD